MRPTCDLTLKPGDQVYVCTVRSGLAGGSCRVLTKTVERVDDQADTVYFTDDTHYNHAEHPRLTLMKAPRG